MSRHMDKNGVRMICAWCGLIIKQGKGLESHGICKSCAEKLMSEYEKKREASGNQQ